MLQAPDTSDQAVTPRLRIAALDRARTCITLLVLLHHSVVNYTHFGSGDRARWLGFDLVVLFNDSFFMACMFFISGLFVRDSLARRGAANFLRHRASRLGVPYLISIFILMPLAYYPTFLRYHLPDTTDMRQCACDRVGATARRERHHDAYDALGIGGKSAGRQRGKQHTDRKHEPMDVLHEKLLDHPRHERNPARQQRRGPAQRQRADEDDCEF